VFLHTICVAFWVGSLVPLVAIVRAPARGTAELAAFSRWIPLPLAVLVVTGSYLIVVELDRPDALWTTGYGEVLSGKLICVAVLIAFGAANRFWLVPRVLDRKPQASRPLAASIAIESVLALAILGTVGLWRFTPPPRSLIAAAPTLIHFHGSEGMVQIEVEPVRARGATFAIEVLDGDYKPMRAQEVGLVIASPTAGIEPIRRAANNVGGSDWEIDDLRIPVGGRWSLRVDILVDDFHKVTLEDDVILPRLP
jgi:copper transport protein